jgi:hypothetical protein
MGQSVVVNNVVEMGDLLLIDTDRSFTGQDGVALTPDQAGEAVPGRLAGGLFDLGLGIDHVFVLQNTITVRHPGGWDESGKAAVQNVVEGFLRFYEDDEVVASS